MNRKRSLSIKSSLYFTFIVPAIILVLILVGSIVLSIVYAKTNNSVVLIVLIAFVVIMAFIYVLAMMFAAKGLKYIYIDGLYGVTRNVILDISKNKLDGERYPRDANIEEFDELNDALDVLSTTYNHALIVPQDVDYTNIPLEHLFGDERFVTLESFKKYIANIIGVSQNYRNALLEVSYDFDEDKLTNEENIRLVHVLRETFRDFKNFLIVPNEDESGYYIYLPHINSFSRIHELCEVMMKNLSVSKKTFDGLKTVVARFSLVCYPHSNIIELFSDLRYAKRQGLPINFYFPDRLSSLSSDSLMQNSANLNNMTKILNSLSALSLSNKERKKSFDIIRRNMDSLITYLDFEEAGIVYVDPNSGQSSIIVHTSTIDNPVFNEGDAAGIDFIRVCNENKDPDFSYYFSSRLHSNANLTKVLDKYGIESGFYYILSDHDIPRALIFFINRNKSMIIDSYICESLFVFSYRIGDYLLLGEKEENFNDTYREINSILMVSDYALYRIDSSDYSIVNFSQHLPTLFPKIKVGEKCYKALYGLDNPCPNCPLRTSKKMMSEIEGHNYETSLSINDRSVKLKRMLVHKVSNESSSGDRFDSDLLINSYSSLAIALRGFYSISGRGYMLVLRIDNHDELVKGLGSEGYLFALRQFISEIKKLTQYAAHIYVHDPISIAILMPEAGQIPVVNLCERIYEASKKTYSFEGYNCSFNVTYIPYNYPQAYPEADAFLKYVMRHHLGNKFEKGKDFIYFPDGEYSRSASRNQFMLAVIDDQFGSNTFNAVLQPMVRAANGAIYGAELFIRINDEYRGSAFNTEQLVQVAAKNGKIPLISNCLVKYIGELYQQYGQSNFKIYGFTRLTINTDFSYFSDENFFDDIYNLMEEYHLPRGFLGFEINESEVMNNRDKFEALSRRIVENHIALICDQYTGASLSIDALKSMGFDEIKIPRAYVSDIEVNEKHRNEITSIMNLAREKGMKVTLVGVENSNQYIMIRDINKDCHLQGFHFFRPLEKPAFIDALRDNNNNK